MRHPTHVGFISLGCAKNLVDSEVMLARLVKAGCVITADPADADAVVVNTCGFLAAARKEALQAIAQAVEYKRTGRCRRVVVVGCLVQRDGRHLGERFPDVDVLLGVNQREQLVQAVLSHEPPALQISPPLPATMPADTTRLRLTPRPYAYLRISEGCDQRCTFCTIPRIRGPMRSKPPDVVLEEARELIADGALELNLIAQDTTAYGRDLDYKPGLAGLLRKLNRLDGVVWIRLMYASPRFFDDAVIAAIAECERVVKYVDLPLQHVNDRVLRAMGRRTKRRDIETLLNRLRDRIPEIAVRTTLMVGFPGETDAAFRELVDFVRRFRFDALGVFAYSREPETPSARRPGQLPWNVKRRRYDALMRTQRTIAFAKADAMRHRHLNLLVERPGPDGRLVTRHAGQAPEVDSVVFVVDPPTRPGPFLRGVCVAREGYDLIARPVQGILPPDGQGARPVRFIRGCDRPCGSTCPTK